MEDCNLLVADGVIICCCCPSLILQLLVFILLKLPYKLVKKSKRLLHRRHYKKRRRRMQNKEVVLIPREREQIEIDGELTRILLQGVSLSPNHTCRGTLHEVDIALEVFSQQGQFAFGSFWGRTESNSFQQDTGQEKFDTVLQYHLEKI